MIAIIRFFVTNRHFTLIITIGCILMSVLSIMSTRVQLNPDIQFPTLTLHVTSPQSDQDTLKKTIVQPLIPLLRENDRIIASQFEISDQGVTGRFTFSIDDDLDKAFWSVNQKIQKISQNLSDQVVFSLNKEQLSQIISPMVIAVTHPNPDERHRLVASLKQKLLLVPSVSGVTPLKKSTQLWVQLNPRHILKHQLTYTQIFTQLTTNQTDTFTGTTPIGNLIVPVSFKSKLSDTKGLQEEPFYTHHSPPVILNSIANFIQKSEEQRIISTVNDQDATLLTIQFRDKANVLGAGTEISNTFQDNAHIRILYNEAEEVRFHITQLIINLIQGLVILCLSLFLLLGARFGIVVSVVLPVTVMFSLSILNVFGDPLQQVSIAGLIIALGLLIDNAIVVAESCMVDMPNGSSGKIESANHYIRQTVRVSYPLFFSTITTILAFLPIYFLNTPEGLFLKSIAKTVAVTLVISIVLAVTIIPFFLSFTSGKSQKLPWGHRQLMALRDRLYVPLLTRMLHYRGSVIVLIGLSVMGCMLCLKKMPFTLFPPAQDQFGYVTVNRYVGDTMNQFHNKVNQVQQEIQNTIATTYMVKTVGVGFPRVNYSMPANTQDPDSAQLFFKISGPRSDKQAQIERIKSKLFQLPFSDAISVQSFLFNQSTTFPITIEIGGDEHDQVSQVAKALVTQIQSNEQVMGVLSSSADHHIRLNYTLNTREIIANSLDLEEVRLAVQLLISGKYVMTLYNDVDDQISVILSINGETGNGQSTSLHDQLRQVVLVNSKGRTFPLSELVSFNLKSMPKSQWVSNDQSTVILTIQVQDATAISTLVESLQQQVNAIEMNAPVSIQIKSEAQNIQDNFMKFGSVALFFIGLIFSILVVVFQSFLMPLIIFTVLPISFLGGSLGLLMTGQSVTLFAFLGFVSLSGIVINDSILLIDAFKKHCDDSPSSSHPHPDLHASLVLSAASRFIPVNTTSITTILSVLPLALDKTLFQPLAVVLIGGLSLSTVVILLTVPALLCWAESNR